jgi:hypothetical protein
VRSQCQPSGNRNWHVIELQPFSWCRSTLILSNRHSQMKGFVKRVVPHEKTSIAKAISAGDSTLCCCSLHVSLRLPYAQKVFSTKAGFHTPSSTLLRPQQHDHALQLQHDVRETRPCLRVLLPARFHKLLVASHRFCSRAKSHFSMTHRPFQHDM